MEVKILGTGCAKCKSLERKVRELVERHNISAEVLYVDDINEMVESGIMMTPGLVIDGEVKSFGIVPKEPQLLKWLNGE
ncbi:Redox-active disulfide protein 2 [hydrothermal vent metagenome]|uniref:Redox-active disulfide protein 2 n=1 Tax=hydrothermal vent metagenome TaxID=652676 RepID=A0A3B1CL21_9ZZZZ